MEKKIFLILFCFLFIFGLSGCKGDENMSEKTLPGKLAEISYDKVSGMVANADYHINVTPECFDAEFWPEDIEDFIYDPETESYRPCVLYDVPVTEEQWNEIEEAVLSVYPEMERVNTKEGFFKKLFKNFIRGKTTVADDADMTYFTFYWKTEDGAFWEKCYVPDHEGSRTLINLLKDLTKS